MMVNHDGVYILMALKVNVMVTCLHTFVSNSQCDGHTVCLLYILLAIKVSVMLRCLQAYGYKGQCDGVMFTYFWP